MFAESYPQFSFPYQIRVSKRAKRLNLKLSAEKGVQVTIPLFTPKSEAFAFLQKNITWIEKNKSIWQTKQAEIELPTEIYLPAVERKWEIYCQDAINTCSQIIEANNKLTYIGKNDDALKLNCLRQWVKALTKQILTVRIDDLSKNCNLPFNKLSFRLQKTLWGSCTQQKNISLNYKLIFLPIRLIDYVLVHELVHTVHLNHSKKFWNLVGIFVSDYKVCRKALQKVDKLIPAWFQ